MRPSARFCSVVAVVGVVAAAAPAVAKETVVDDFEAPDSPMPWVFSNGSEFPGAMGSFTSGTGHTGKGGILEYDLTKGGHYVSASLTLGTPITAAAIAYWAKVPAGIHATLRVTDSSGQTLQYTVSRPLEAFDANAWFREVVALDAPSSHFGGPDDGVVHQPVKAVSLLAADPPEPSAGRIAFDDVVAIDVLAPRIDPRAPATSPAPASAADLASRLGVNVHFTKDDTALDLAQQAGFTVVRQDLGWSGVEHTKGSYDFSALDTLVASLATRGMKLLLILDYMNSLYPGADSADFATATIPAFAALSLSLAAAAGGSSASGGAGNAGVAGASGDGGNGGDGGANAGGDRGSMASAGAGGAGNAGSTGTGAATSRAGATGTGATSGTGRAGSSGTGGDGSGPGGGFDTGGSSTNGADAGTGSADDSASCGCSLPHTSDSRATWTVAALGALVLRRRRAASRPQRR